MDVDILSLLVGAGGSARRLICVIQILRCFLTDFGIRHVFGLVFLLFLGRPTTKETGRVDALDFGGETHIKKTIHSPKTNNTQT